MSIYMSRLFRSSNSSILLQSGTALQSEVIRLREKTLLVNSGIGSPKICSQDEATIKPNNPKTRFETKVGSMGVSSGAESLIQKQNLERFFIDLVAGDSVIKERASATFNDSVGPAEAVPGEPVLLLPRKFRQNRAWMELNKIWRMNSRVRGFVLAKGRGGYAVGIAGFVGFLPFRKSTRIYTDRFVIESINSKTRNLVLFNQGHIQGYHRWEGAAAADSALPVNPPLRFKDEKKLEMERGLETRRVLDLRNGAVDGEEVIKGNTALNSLEKLAKLVL